MEPLLPHFNHFYEQDEQLTPPLKLELCARLQGETVRVVEPLQHMLAGLRRVLRVAAPPNTGTEAGNFANLLGTGWHAPALALGSALGLERVHCWLTAQVYWECA